MAGLNSLLSSFAKLFSWLIKICAIALLAIPIGAVLLPIVITVFFTIREWPSNVTSEPKYSEIVNHVFDAQTDLILTKGYDGKQIYLEDWSLSDVIGTVKRGTKIRVKKIRFSQRWAGGDLEIMVTVEDPKWKDLEINAIRLIVDYITVENTTWEDKKALFDPAYLK